MGSEGLVPLRKKDGGRVFESEREFTKLTLFAISQH